MSVQQGMANKAVGQHRTEQNNAVWKAWATSWAEYLATTKGEVSVDDIRDLCQQHNYHPSTPAVWGTLFNKHSWWVVRRQKSRHETNNARIVYVWRQRRGDDPVVPNDFGEMTREEVYQAGYEAGWRSKS